MTSALDSSAAATGAARRRGRDRTVARASRLGRARASRCCTCSLLLVLPVGMVFLRAFEGGIEPVLKAIARPAFQSAFWLTVADHRSSRCPVSTVLGIITALAIVRRRFPGRGAPQRAGRPAVRPVAGGHRPVAVPGLRHATAPSAAFLGGPRHHGHLRGAGHGPGDDLRVPAVRHPRGRPGAARDRHRPGGGGLHAGRVAAGARSGASRCRPSAGASCTASS